MFFKASRRPQVYIIFLKSKLLEKLCIFKANIKSEAQLFHSSISRNFKIEILLTGRYIFHMVVVGRGGLDIRTIFNFFLITSMFHRSHTKKFLITCWALKKWSICHNGIFIILFLYVCKKMQKMHCILIVMSQRR